jgi:RND family efflux transporter MFP subunit
MSWLRLWCCMAVGAAVLIGTGCQERVKPGAVAVKREVVSGVQVAEVSLSRLPEYYETTATVRANTVSAVASKVMGVVTAIHVKEGDTVTAGQELLSIDDRDLTQRLKAAEAGHREALKALDAVRQNRTLAEVTARRYRQLHEARAISQQEMDQVNTQSRVAAAEVERAQAMAARMQAGVTEAQVHLGYTRISAPTSGMITEKRIDVGSMAVPGTPLLIVEDQSAFKLEINVDERLSGNVGPGMPVEMELDAIGLVTTGLIREVVPVVDPAVRTFLIKVGLAGGGVRSGMYARVKIPLGQREAILVPEQAVVVRGQLTGVYKVSQDGVVTLTMVRAGKKYGPNLEILSGITPGERVIVGGVIKAIDGGLLKEG